MGIVRWPKVDYLYFKQKYIAGSVIFPNNKVRETSEWFREVCEHFSEERGEKRRGDTEGNGMKHP